MVHGDEVSALCRIGLLMLYCCVINLCDWCVDYVDCLLWCFKFPNTALKKLLPDVRHLVNVMVGSLHLLGLKVLFLYIKVFPNSCCMTPSLYFRHPLYYSFLYTIDRLCDVLLCCLILYILHPLWQQSSVYVELCSLWDISSSIQSMFFLLLSLCNTFLCGISLLLYRVCVLCFFVYAIPFYVDYFFVCAINFSVECLFVYAECVFTIVCL